MNNLTPQNLAFLVRSRLGEPDDRNAAKYIAMIPQALKAMARKVAADPFKRDLLMTDPEETVVSIGSDLDDFNILLEYIDCGQIYHDSSPFPLVKIPAQQRSLAAQFADDFIYYFVEGENLKLIGNFTGSLKLAVPYFPKDLSCLPESNELENLLIDKIIELCNIGSDTAQDGEK